jgi:hypothetical protein
MVFFLDYTMNKMPDMTELREIAKRWNCDNFDFYMDLGVRAFFPISNRYSYSYFQRWFFGRRMAEQEIRQRRENARKAAA